MCSLCCGCGRGVGALLESGPDVLTRLTIVGVLVLCALQRSGMMWWCGGSVVRDAPLCVFADA